MSPEREVRLPRSVLPRRYVLTLTPDLEHFTFRGEAHIDVNVVEPVSSVVLNAAELTVHQAQAQLAEESLEASSLTLDEAAERLLVMFPEALPAGSATLSLSFSGTLNDRLLGFYQSRFTTPEGDALYGAATQFESTDARRAFPCWDEPAFKAIFEVTLVIPTGMTAISNTPIVEETAQGEGTKAVRFAETPPMSPYLLAFVIGPLEAVETKAQDGTVTRVWATPDKVEFGRFAVKTSARLLDYLNDYFGIPYPLEKLDHIALPDFAAGAMENWGAITYRERVLLFDPATSTADTKQAIAEVLAHEMAHMWFGDLVTMAWWDSLWLNESFASWMGNKAVDALFPEWAMWTQFLYQDAMGGLVLDGLRSSHPVEVPVHDPEEIDEIFDAISYNKGASILWMLEQYLGEEAFRRGVQAYFAAHEYGNARTEDLWEALGSGADADVLELMDTWVQQTGFPLVTVESDRGDGGLRLRLSQRRFLYEHLESPKEEETLWQVPLRIRRAGAEAPETHLLARREGTYDLGPGSRRGSADWVKVNAGQSGFYRVNYSREEWDRLQVALEEGGLSPRDRLGLQSDAYALMRAGFLPAVRYLAVTQAYTEEKDSSVWRALTTNLRGFETLLADEPYLNGYLGYGRDLLRPAAQRVGWTGPRREAHLEALKRTAILGRLGMMEEASALHEAATRFAAYLESPETLDPDLKDVVFSLTGRQADRALYDQLWDLQKRATLNEEKVRLLSALGNPRQPELLRETLNRSLSDEVRSQDTVLVINSVGTNRYGRDLAWQFVRDHWDELYERYGKTGFLIRRLVGVAEAFTSREREEEVEAFFQEHPSPAVRRKLEQTLERIRLNAAWVDGNREDLQEWLSSWS